MSDISDELRKFTNTYDLNSLQIYELKRIADRIDAAHRSALEKLAAQLDETSDMREFCGRIEQAAANREDVTLWGVDYVALPVDADGVPIHVGDTVYGEDGMSYKVVSISFGRWPGGVTVNAVNGFSKWRDLIPGKMTHISPDSLESIARDLEDWADGNISGSAQSFADRIREVAEREGER